MDDPGSSTYFVGAIWLCLSAFFSGAESALFSSDPISLATRYKSHKNLARTLSLKDDPGSLLFSLLLGNTFANVMFASAVATVCMAIFAGRGNLIDLAAILIGTFLVLIFGEIAPKLAFGADPERFAIALSPGLVFFSNWMKPVASAVQERAATLSRRFPRFGRRSEELTEARLQATVDYLENEGAIRGDEKDMILGVMGTKETEAVDVMVPRPRMIAMQDDRSALSGLRLILESGVSRIPLFSGTRDNITGILSMKDLVTSAQGRDEGSWEETLGRSTALSFAAAPYFVPEGKRITDLLREMRSLGVHMCIVVDEFDGVSGLVTLEDVIEEIVGDIRDEYDQRDQGIVVTEDGGFVVPGSMSLSDLESILEMDLEFPDCDSVAGVVMRGLGRVANVGDSLSFEDPPVRFLVRAVDGPRIREVVVWRTQREDIS